MNRKCLPFQTDMTRVVTHSLGGEAGPNYDEYKDWAKATGSPTRGTHDYHHKGSGNRGADNPDGKQIASASWDGTLRLWNATSGDVVKTFRGHQAENSSVCFAPNGAHLISAGEDKTVRLWDVKTGKTVARLQGHTDAVLCLSISRDGRFIVAGSKEAVRVWQRR